VKDPELVSPDGPTHDQFLLDRKGNDEIQLDLFLSYGSNPPLYPKWQAYFREHRPPVLIVWGKNDPIFPAAGAEPYRRDLKNIDFHLLHAGHFALETNGAEIARLMRDFLGQVGAVERGALAFGETVATGAAIEQAKLAGLAEPAGDGEVSGVAASEVGTLGIQATESREVVHGSRCGPEREARTRVEELL
jgi:hypothetical protein